MGTLTAIRGEIREGASAWKKYGFARDQRSAHRNNYQTTVGAPLPVVELSETDRCLRESYSLLQQLQQALGQQG